MSSVAQTKLRTGCIPKKVIRSGWFTFWMNWNHWSPSLQPYHHCRHRVRIYQLRCAFASYLSSFLFCILSFFPPINDIERINVWETFWVPEMVFRDITSSLSSWILSDRSYSFVFSSFFFLSISNRFFTWSTEERSTFIDMPRLRWSEKDKQIP